MLSILLDFNFIKLNKNFQNLNKILYISDNIESTKKGRPHFGNVRSRGILLTLNLEFYFLYKGYE